MDVHSIQAQALHIGARAYLGKGNIKILAQGLWMEVSPDLSLVPHDDSEVLLLDRRHIGLPWADIF